MIFNYIKRRKFWESADRLGPDMLSTHRKLFYPDSMRKLCKKKFKYFADTAEFRPFAYAMYTSNISLGERVVIRPGIVLAADEHATITIEDDVMFGMGVHIYVNNHRFSDINIPIIDQGYTPSQDVVIKKGSWIGANSIILPGVIIGANSVIGAGSIVTKSIPDFTVAVGNPAMIIKNIK